MKLSSLSFLVMAALAPVKLAQDDWKRSEKGPNQPKFTGFIQRNLMAYLLCFQLDKAGSLTKMIVSEIGDLPTRFYLGRIYNKVTFKTLMSIKPISMVESSKDHFCLQCNSKIDLKIFEYSLKIYKFPFCEDCQIWFIGKVFDTTKETIQLYFALKGRGVTAQLEKHDKLKRVDIAIEESHLHIEVDSAQQNYNVTEALQDLKKTHSDFPDGSITLKVPNSLVKFNIDQTTDIIHKLVIENKIRILSASKKIAG